jgi:DNA-binding NtrC family response regulator
MTPEDSAAETPVKSRPAAAEPAAGGAKILVVEDDEGLGEILYEEIGDAGYAGRRAATAEEALEVIAAWTPEIVVSDLRLPGADGLALLRETRRRFPEHAPDFLIITGFGSVSTAVESLKAGAEDFLTKPIDLEHFRLSLRRILEKRALREQIERFRAATAADATFHGIHGRSPAMESMFAQIRQLARADGPVLISGESGTGKELVARAIHLESKTADHPFIAVNCAGIPEQLLESEFFGHAAGAFTGAGKARQGIFAEAEGGTLFLDEISEMPPQLQAKLLRMLQDGKIRPVGSNREVQVKVRILAATNRDIEERVREGDFREDLFYRLETFPLRVPPLREREDDIALLTAAFVVKYASAADKRVDGVSEAARAQLERYPFPGNVRELQNAIERAVAFCPGGEIRPEHLPPRILRKPGAATRGDAVAEAIGIDGDSLPSLEEVERRYIRHVVEKVGGNKRLAASILGIARRTLYRRLE